VAQSIAMGEEGMKATRFMQAVFDVVRRDGIYGVYMDVLTKEFETFAQVQWFASEAKFRLACSYPRYPEAMLFLR
jgi:hypothetical protein